MKKNQNGFSVIEALLIVGVLAVIGGSGYALYHGRQTPKAKSTTAVTSTSKAKPVPTATAGTAQSIDNLTTQDTNNETLIDNKHTSAEATNAQSANTAAANLGGAYNESSL